MNLTKMQINEARQLLQQKQAPAFDALVKQNPIPRALTNDELMAIAAKDRAWPSALVDFAKVNRYGNLADAWNCSPRAVAANDERRRRIHEATLRLEHGKAKLNTARESLLTRAVVEDWTGKQLWQAIDAWKN